MMKLHYLEQEWPWGKSIVMFTQLDDGGTATITLNFENSNPGVAFISDLIVAECSRRKGVATKLIKQCELMASNEGKCFRVDLKTYKGGFLKQMYEKFGYRVIDEDSTSYWMSKMLQ